MVNMAFNVSGGGGGATTTAVVDDDDSGGGGGGSSSTTTVDIAEQTLGTTSLGTATGQDDDDSNLVDGGSDDDEISITDTGSPDESSPAGGAGFTGSASRFLGVDRERVEEAVDQTSESAVGDVVEDVANAQIASDSPLPDRTPNVIPWDEYRQSVYGEDGSLLGGVSSSMLAVGAAVVVGGLALLGGD